MPQIAILNAIAAQELVRRYSLTRTVVDSKAQIDGVIQILTQDTFLVIHVKTFTIEEI